MSNYAITDNRSRFLYPVIYTDTLFDITELLLRKPCNTLRYTLVSLMKAIDWEYEREWRLIFAQDIISHEQLYLMGKPNVVYLGTRIRPEHQKEITTIAEGQGFNIYKMALSREKYLLESRIPKDADTILK